MKNYLIPFLLLFFFTSVLTTSLSAQKKDVPPKNVSVEMRDGNTVIGLLKARQGDTVVIESTTLGILNLNIKNIKSITALDAQRLKGGEYWFENPHASRGFFAPTGFGLRKGEGYYSNIYVFLNSAAYGFTDNFTIGAGADAFTVFTGNAPFVMYVTPKLSFQAGKDFSYGIGVLAGSFGFNTERTTAGIVYGVGTFGNRDNNLSVALGYGFAQGELTQRPTITISGQYRAGRKISLMTENYILPDVIFGTTGVRFMNSNFAFDLGLMYGNAFGEISGVAPIPFLGIAIPFGHKRI